MRSTFIVGFPGETEARVRASCSISSKRRELDRVGCFAYSPVDGATANALPDPVPPEVAEDRRARFMAKQAEVSARRLAAKVGRTMTVLVDEIADGVAIGRSAADAPEIDGVVRIDDGAALAPGAFVARDDRSRRGSRSRRPPRPLIRP